MLSTEARTTGIVHCKVFPWLHFAAISLSLSESLSEICEEALEAASSRKITVSSCAAKKFWTTWAQAIVLWPA
jgi:hypothetical protein